VIRKSRLYKTRETACRMYGSYCADHNVTDQRGGWTFTTWATLHFRIRKAICPRNREILRFLLRWNLKYTELVL